jgi:NAD-dependent dihydropyrimidine dehydrogenase PreA subunit
MAEKRIDAHLNDKCKRIIDACYNYCILFSIRNVSCEYSIDYGFPEAIREILERNDSPDQYEALSDSEWALLGRVVAKYKRKSFVDEDTEGTLGSPFQDKFNENRARWRNHLTSTLLHGLAVPLAYVVAVILIIIGEKISGDILENMPLGGTGVFAVIAMVIPFIPDLMSELFSKITDRATGYTGLASGLRDGWTVIKDMKNIKRMMGGVRE